MLNPTQIKMSFTSSVGYNSTNNLFLGASARTINNNNLLKAS